MGIQINGQTDTISATDGSFTISGASGNLTGNLTGNVTGNLTGNVTSSGISTFSDTVNVGAGKSIRLYGASSGYSEIIAAAGSASTTFTLPANGGSASQYLQTDGSGGLSWQTLPDSGKILQVQEFVLDDQPFTNSEDSFVDVTGWSDTITAAASTNKIIIDISLGRVANNSSSFRHTVFRIMKSTDGGSSYSAIGVPTGTGNKLAATFVTLPPNNTAYGDSTAFRYIDTAGTTNEITYKLQWTNQDTSTVYLNRAGGAETDSSDAAWTRTISTMYLTEVAA